MIHVRNLRFAYPDGSFRLSLDRLDLEEGGRLCITGPSGSGKTTLIQLLSGILQPREGTIRVAGVELTREKPARVRRFRLDKIGFIFQGFELLEYLTVERNVLLPFYLAGRSVAAPEVRARMARLLEKTGLAGKERAYPNTLSHGEKQRTAVCRALITWPRLVIGDEPTANLDGENAARILDLILELVEGEGATIVEADGTHRPLTPAGYEHFRGEGPA